jgi:hypothetical protein
METAMDDRSERPSINMSAIPVAGIGGLGMLAMVIIMGIAFPQVGILASSAVAAAEQRG